jgi:hypothetical protein
MTSEEFEQLKPGDKVVFIRHESSPSDTWHLPPSMEERLFNEQEKNGGYFVISLGPEPVRFGPVVKRAVLVLCNSHPYLLCEEIELYKPGWSYERDY